MRKRYPTALELLDELSVKTLMQQATARAAISFAPQGAPRLIIKSIATKQRPRRPVEDAPAPSGSGGKACKKKPLTRAFSLLLCTVRFSEVRLFLKKSRVGSGCSVYTRSENAADRPP
jgi:hypothetical protein